MGARRQPHECDDGLAARGPFKREVGHVREVGEKGSSRYNQGPDQRCGSPEVLVPSTSRSKAQTKVDYSNVWNIEKKKKEDILSRIFERNPIAITNTT